MADVTGPISSLPGSLHSAPHGMMCDQHPERVAVRRVQGETDSFGSEMVDMCQECLDAHLAYRQREAEEAATTPRYCEWHKGPGLNVSSMRDHDEGMSGRLYDVCGSCRAVYNERARQEADAHHAEYGDGYDYDDYEPGDSDYYRGDQPGTEDPDGVRAELPSRSRPQVIGDRSDGIEPVKVVYKKRRRIFQHPQG